MQEINFDFVGDNTFKDLLERDYRELENCIKAGATKSILVLSGSILEALLIEYFSQFTPVGKTKTQILKMSLNELSDLGLSENIITDKEHKLASVLKDFRNLIHPGREIRKKEQFSIESANIAFNVLNMILESIKEKYKKKYGYSADEIFEKLKLDWNFRSIYDKVVLKLNINERVKLAEHLINFDAFEKSFWLSFREDENSSERPLYELEEVRHLFVRLKPLLPDAVIKHYLEQMIIEIETGKTLDAFSLFNLFHDNMDMLTDPQRENIVVYMLDFYGNVLEDSMYIRSEQTFSTIGKFITTTGTQKALEQFIGMCVANFGGNNIKYEMDVFEQVWNSLIPATKTKAEVFLTDYLTRNGEIPNSIYRFYDEIIERGILPLPKREIKPKSAPPFP